MNDAVYTLTQCGHRRDTRPSCICRQARRARTLPSPGLRACARAVTSRLLCGGRALRTRTCTLGTPNKK